MKKCSYGNFALLAWQVPDLLGNILPEETSISPEYVVFDAYGYEPGRDSEVKVHSCIIEGAEQYTTAKGDSLPELAYMQVANTYHDVHLIYLGMQLVSAYSDKTPICTIKAIEDCATNLKRHHGRKTVLRLTPYLCEGSRSPMETITYMLLSLPVHLGGRGFRKLQLNYPIWSEKHQRGFYADLCWPEKKLIIEYQSAYHKDLFQAKADQERRAILESEGYKVVEVWARDIYDVERFEDLVLHLQKLTNKRIRYRSGKFILNQQRIRDILDYKGMQTIVCPTALEVVPEHRLARRSWIQEAYQLYLVYYENFVFRFFSLPKSWRQPPHPRRRRRQLGSI